MKKQSKSETVPDKQDMKKALKTAAAILKNEEMRKIAKKIKKMADYIEKNVKRSF